MPTIAFLAIVVLASGLIAYFADWLGRKLGKKRLTIGKLRPRHTAALGTVLSGMIISILTMVIVMVVSSDVREWILRGNAAIGEAKERLGQLRKVEKQLGLIKTQLTSAEARLEKQQEQVKLLTTKREEATKQASVLRGQLVTIQRQTDSMKAARDTAQRDLQRTQRAKADAEGRLATTKTALAARQKILNEATKQLAEANKRMIDLDHEILDLEGKLKAKDKELKDKENEVGALDRQITDFKRQIADAQEDLLAATNSLERVNRELESKNFELDAAKADIKRAETRLRTLTEGLDANLVNTRLKGMIITGGEEMARIQLEPNQRAEDVRAALENVLSWSRRQAEERGAKAPRSGGMAASVKDQQVEGRLITAQAQMDAVIQAATGLPEESVIIASSLWNVFEDEDVPLVVVAYRNPLIYKQGQIVAEARVDGREDDGVVIRQLTDFLSDKLKKKALADKMIPAAGREQSLGSVTFEELFSLARDIKETNRQVRLVAVAKQDTRAADTLRFDLRIR